MSWSEKEKHLYLTLRVAFVIIFTSFIRFAYLSKRGQSSALKKCSWVRQGLVWVFLI